MGESRAKEISFVVKKDLRFVHQPSKRGGMDDAIAIPLVVASRRRRRFCMTPTPRFIRMASVRLQSKDISQM